jgi:nicotinamidase-related amidase
MRKRIKTAFIVVDVLKGLTLEGGNNYYPTATAMLEDDYGNKINAMRDNGALIIYVCGSGNTMTGFTASPHSINPELSGRNLAAIKKDPVWEEFDDRLPIMENDIILRKHTYSAFWGTPLLEILQQNGIENVLVGGIKTNVCCRQTTIDAVSHGYRTFIIKDMTSTNNDEIKEYHLEEMNRYFAKVLDSDEVIKRLKNGDF